MAYYIEDDLCENILEWFEASKEDLKFEGDEVNVYYSEPHTEVEYPAIFIYPVRTGGDVPQFNNRTVSNVVSIGVSAFTSPMTWIEITKKVNRWAAKIRYVLRGVINMSGTATDGSTETLIDSSLINKYPNDFFNDLYLDTVTTVDDEEIEQKVKVLDYDSATGTFTFDTVATAIDDSTTYDLSGLDYWTRNELLSSARVASTLFYPNVPILNDTGETFLSSVEIIFEGTQQVR